MTDYTDYSYKQLKRYIDSVLDRLRMSDFTQKLP